ncbi:hypothetical protein [Pseudomonas oryzihabitans]|uniref:hypothetical protein n=1 Tax=Pseudomonas oryzihabitans TaxID=47885 RepID=UPI00286D298D|nr:hypothetical protein [Pseudomonas psychrotolerans]
MRINSYYSFFRAIETRWGVLPTYSELVAHFTTAGLRRAETPMRWLSEIQAVRVNAEIRERYSEERRIQNILDEIGEPWSKKLLNEYFLALSSRIKKNETDIRSVRLALRAAANLLGTACLKINAFPTKKTLESFWRSYPGQVSALAGFIGYLNRVYHLQLKWQPEERWLAKARIDKAERELVALLKVRQQESNFEIKWVARGLAYFHGVRRVSRKSLVYKSTSYDGVDGFDVEYGGVKLWVPSADSFSQKSQ